MLQAKFSVKESQARFLSRYKDYGFKDKSTKKAKITTNVKVNPTRSSGLSKKSIADCLQTRPIDHRHRLVRIRGELTHSEMNKIDQALKIVFELN